MRTRHIEEVAELINRPHRQLRVRHPWWRYSGNDIVLEQPKAHRVSKRFVKYDVGVGDRLGSEWPAVSSTSGKQISLQSFHLCRGQRVEGRAAEATDYATPRDPIAVQR